jgi:hypothetical protein
MRGIRIGRGRSLGLGRLAFLLLALGLGCGQKYDLPPQPPPALPPPPGYSKYAIWNMGTTNPVGIYGQGGLIYLAEETAPAEGRVRAYQADVTVPLPSSYVSRFEGLVHPSLVSAVRAESVFVFVADADTIKRYPELGGSPLSHFTDPNWRGGINGIAADNQLNVYVSFGNKVVAYDSRGRLHHVVADNRSGSGMVAEPRGLHCIGNELLVADQRTGQIVRLRTTGTNQFSATAIPASDAVRLTHPSDVTCDSQGNYIYVADTGNDRILKFSFTTGALIDSVYSPTKATSSLAPDSSLTQPRYLAESSPYVFVSDLLRHRVVVFRYSNQ